MEHASHIGDRKLLDHKRAVGISTARPVNGTVAKINIPPGDSKNLKKDLLVDFGGTCRCAGPWNVTF